MVVRPEPSLPSEVNSTSPTVHYVYKEGIQSYHGKIDLRHIYVQVQDPVYTSP